MEDILSHSRYRILLNLLLDSEGYVSSLDLSKKLSVSNRTIKRDIFFMNEVLKKYGCEILSKQGEGYRLRTGGKKKIAAKIAEYDYYSSPQDVRLYGIAMALLFKPEGIDLYDMEEAFYISRSTLENDIKRLKKLLSHSYPSVTVKRRNENVFLDGDEFTLRLFFNKILHAKYNYIDQTLNIDHSQIDLSEFENIRNRTISIITKYAHLHDLAIADIAAYLFITRSRLKMHRQATVPAHTENYLINHAEIINKLADELFQMIATSKTETDNYPLEREYLAIKLSFMNIGIPEKMKKTDVIQIMPAKVISLVKKILFQIDLDYKFNLSHDDELFVGLSYHISALLNREKYPELFAKPRFTMPIKKAYPFIFESSLSIRGIIKENIGRTIDEDDLSYIAARIAASIEKNKPGFATRKIKIAIVSHYGASYTELLYETLKSAFYPIIEIVGVYYVYEIEKVPDAHPDIIIHTFNIDNYQFSNRIKLLSTTYIFTRENKIKLLDLIEDVKQEAIHTKNQNVILSKFDKRLFFYGLNLKSKKDVISFLTNMFIINDYADKLFLDKILEKEELSNTVINDRAAVLNPLDYHSKQSKIGVLILDQKIKWNQNDVEMVFILSLTKEDQKDLGVILHGISEITSHTYIFNDLLNTKDYEAFIELAADNM